MRKCLGSIVSLFSLTAMAASLPAAPALAADIEPLQARGEQFVNPVGQDVRFWGTNLVAFYPNHALADKVAANLANRQINLVRPHHMLRPSSDWVQAGAPIVALQSYKGNTRQADAEAWDRFDYLNAALRKQGIYLMLSVWWTRNYQPGDVEILKTDDADRKAWMAGIEELNGWPWQKGFDVRKMLCVVDERVAALEEEFARQLLTHENPYTKRCYADDPQVLTLELMNEASTEYAIICGNRFPDYFQQKLLAKWQAFARDAGIEPGDLYKPAGPAAVAARARFLRKLDEDFFVRMKNVIRSTGSKAAVTYSNLWRGDEALKMHAEHADYIEDHMYADPMVASRAEDLFLNLSRTALAGKPFIVGELNQGEGAKALAAQSPTRSMLLPATAAYGSLQNWSGAVFFAWLHGDKAMGEDGWSTAEERAASLGNMVSDGMQLDHLRTCGLIFRRGLVARSTNPITICLDEPLLARDYNALMRSKYMPKPGWQSIHAFRRTFGAAPATQAAAAWNDAPPAGPLVSDTRQIIKDIGRRQLTLAAPQAEFFSGWMDGKIPAGLKHLRLAGEGFSTVVIVADDSVDLGQSTRIVVSRTNLNAAMAQAAGPAIGLDDMRPTTAGKQWRFRATRPRNTILEQDIPMVNGQLVLPLGEWHEAELELK